MRRPPNLADDSFEFEDLPGLTPEEAGPVDIGDFVKLVFRIRTHDSDSVEWISTERMWVIVTGFEGDCLVGTLDNSADATDDLKAGREVVFERKHIHGRMVKRVPSG